MIGTARFFCSQIQETPFDGRKLAVPNQREDPADVSMGDVGVGKMNKDRGGRGEEQGTYADGRRTTAKCEIERKRKAKRKRGKERGR